MKKILIIILFFSVSKYYSVENPETAFLEIHIKSLTIDSQRVYLPKTGYFDVFFKDKKLWNLKRYTENGVIIDIGNFKEGNGKIKLIKSNKVIYCNLNNGLFEGEQTKCRITKKRTELLIQKNNYSKGIRNGKHTSYYTRVKGTPKHIEYEYNMGEKVSIKIYGKYIPFFYWVFSPFPNFRQSILVYKSKELCREHNYKGGKLIETNCNSTVKSCDCP